MASASEAIRIIAPSPALIDWRQGSLTRLRLAREESIDDDVAIGCSRSEPGRTECRSVRRIGKDLGLERNGVPLPIGALRLADHRRIEKIPGIKLQAGLIGP